MKAKEHLIEVIEPAKFKEIPEMVVNILNDEFGADVSSKFWLAILNNPQPSFENFCKFVLCYHKVSNSMQSTIEFINFCKPYWDTAKLLSDMVRSGILDKYRG